MHKRYVSLLAAAVIVMSACTAAASGSPAAAPSGAGPAATGTAEPTANPVDITHTNYKPTAPTGATGGTIVLSEWQSPAAVNPYYSQAFTDTEAFGALSFDGLVGVTNDLAYVPDLASEVPTVANGDVKVNGTTMDVEWKLKPNMKWSDGQDITCADLTGTWKWIIDKDNTGLTNGTTGWEDITGIDATTPTDCVMHFGKIYEGYLTIVAPLLPAHYISTVPVKDAGTKLYPLADPSKGVYSGPYIPKSYTTDQEIDFLANPAWAAIGGHAPYIDGVKFKLYGTAEDMEAGFKAGDIDEAQNLNNADLPSLTAFPDNEKIVHDSLTYELLAFNNDKLSKKFGDAWKGLVKAMRLGIDREAIAAGPLQGTVSVTNNFISPLTWYYKDEGGSTKADAAGASAALTAAGFTIGADGVATAPNGAKASLQFCTTTRKVRGDTLKLIASQLKPLGIVVNVTQVPAEPNFFGSYNAVPADQPCNLLRGNYDVGEHAYISPLDPLGGYNVYESTANPDIPPHNGANETRVNIPALDDAYKAVKNSVDFSVVQKAMFQVEDIYASDQNTFELPLYLRKDVWLVNPKIQNFVGNPTSASAQWNIGDWWLQQ